MNKNTLRKLICNFISFFCCITIFIASTIICSILTYMSPEKVIESLNQSNYYNGVVEASMQKFEDLAIPGGIQKEVFDGVLSVEDVEADVSSYIRDSFNNKTHKVSTDRLSNAIKNNIMQYANQQNIDITAETEASIDNLVKLCVDEYNNSLKIPFINEYASVSNKLFTLYKILLPIDILLIAFLIYMLFKLNIYKHRVFRYLAYSLSGSSLMLLSVPAFLLINKPYNKLNITPEYFHNFIVNFLEKGLFAFLISGVSLLVLSFVMMFITKLMKEK